MLQLPLPILRLAQLLLILCLLGPHHIILLSLGSLKFSFSFLHSFRLSTLGFFDDEAKFVRVQPRLGREFFVVPRRCCRACCDVLQDSGVGRIGFPVCRLASFR